MSDPAGELLSQTPQQSCQLGNGETLTYREFQRGQKKQHVLIFIPGYASDADSFAAVLATRSSFADHRIIAVNPRGYNGSTNNVSVYSHEDNADDIKLFMDKIGLTKAMVMGYSTGGGAACYLALKYPESITAAFMVSSVPLDGMRLPKMTPDGRLAGGWISSRQEVEQLVQAMETLGSHSESVETFHGLMKAYSRPPESIPSIDSPLMIRWHKGACAHISRVQAQTANAWFNVTPIQTPVSPPSRILQTLQVPIIVLHGQQDVVISRDQVKAVTELAIAEQWAPPGLLSYYEHSGGHFGIFHEVPDECCALYRKALQEQVLSHAGNDDTTR